MIVKCTYIAELLLVMATMVVATLRAKVMAVDEAVECL